MMPALNGTVLPVSAWRIPRYFKKGLDLFDWGSTVGSIVTTWRGITDWCNLLNPGDPIEAIDGSDFEVRHTGDIVFIKRVLIRDMSDGDYTNFFPTQYRGRIGGVSVDTVLSMCRYMYDLELSADRQINVIGYRLKWARPVVPDNNREDRLAALFSSMNISLSE